MKTIQYVLLLSIIFVISGLFATTQAQECIVLYLPGEPSEPPQSYGDPQILEGFQPTIVRRVYVAAHIVRTSSGQNGISLNDVSIAISQLNTAFSDVMIEFVLDHTDYINNDNYTTLSSSNFPSLSQINVVANKLNIYFCPQGTVNGTAYLNSNRCAVTNSAAINGSTLSHEVGHNLFLYHTHGHPGHSQELVNGSNCLTPNVGDLLCDTPAEPYNNDLGIRDYVYGNCVYFGTLQDPNGQYYTPDTQNFMGYAPAQCRNRFSTQQIQRMNQTLSTSLSYLIRVPVPLSNKIDGNIIFNSGSQPSTLSVIGGVTINSGNNVNLLDGESYDIRTNQERFPNYQSNGNIKHNNWNVVASEFKLTENFTIDRTSSPHRDANFISLNYGKIEANLEGQLIQDKGNFEFNDPWYVKSDGSQPGNYWIPCTFIYEPNGKHGASEKGVFLDQSGPPLWNPPYYSVRAVSPQTININGKNHNFYFQNWSGSNANFQNANNITTGVVFTNDNAVVNANLKGNLVSNTQTAISSNSQKKVARTSDGTLHMVYESMSQII